MNIAPFPQINNSDSGGPPAVMTVIDARKYPIIARHWPGLRVINGDLAFNDNCRARLSEGVRHEAQS